MIPAIAPVPLTAQKYRAITRPRRWSGAASCMIALQRSTQVPAGTREATFPAAASGLLLPAEVIPRLELAPEGDLRLARCDLRHHRADVRLLRFEERVEARCVRPFVDDHDLAIAAVEAVRDCAGCLRSRRDAADHVRVRLRHLLELVWVPRHAQRHDHGHLNSL